VLTLSEVTVEFRTVSVRAAEVLPRVDESPTYVALIECEPAVSAGVLMDAAPFTSVAVPISAPPSFNWTVPVAVEGVTLMLKVIATPVAPGLALGVTAVVDWTRTVWVRGAEVELA
jgi:hypothetical protein